MAGRLWCLVVVVVLVGAGCSFKPLVLTPKAATPEGVAPVVVSVPTVLVLDGSGSMTTDDAPGPRIDAAKAAAHTLIKALPDDAVIGLQTYGTTTGSAPEDKPAGCRDVTTVIPLGPLDRQQFTSKIDSITPSGYTPISLALQTAADQLPADTSPQAIVVVSDGEDTCDTPPCDTAAALKKTHPGLNISTVGFKLDGPAADQLRCIATATGGLFVQAANATQLTTRLLATQNLDQANQSLSATGMNGIDLGTSITDIRATHPDFPEANPTGTTTVVWKDCDYTFTDGTLSAIAPHNGGRTIDGVTVGTQLQNVIGLYGEPLDVRENANGTTTAWFSAADQGDAAFEMEVDGYQPSSQPRAGVIKRIVLCTCRPHPQPEQIIAVNPDDYEQHSTEPPMPDGTVIHNSYGLYFKEPTGKWWCHIDQGDVTCSRGGTGDELMATLGIPGEPMVEKEYSTDGQTYPPNAIGIVIRGSGGPVAKMTFMDVGSDRGRLQDLFAQTKILDYGRSITAGGYTCVVLRSGISCDGAEGSYIGHGFTFSDSGFTLR